MSLEVELLHRIEALTDRLEAHLTDHPLEHHDHLLDSEEHAAHHAVMDKPKERRAGEQRKGERRLGGDFVGEDRRAG
jgi:hypothetical protein